MGGSPTRHRSLLGQIVIAVLAFASVASALDAAVISTPYSIHVPLLLKLVSKSRGLPGRLGAEVVIAVAGNDSLTEVRSIANGKQLLGRVIRVVSLEDMRAAPDIIYVGPDSAWPVPKVRRRAREIGAITITGVGAFVLQGVALGIQISPSRHPKILVNLPVAQAQGIDLPSDILGISEVVR